MPALAERRRRSRTMAVAAMGVSLIGQTGTAAAQPAEIGDRPPFFEGSIGVSYAQIQTYCVRAPCPQDAPLLSLRDGDRGLASIDDYAFFGALTRAFGEPLAYGRVVVEGAAWLTGAGCPAEPPSRDAVAILQGSQVPFDCRAVIRVDRMIEGR